MTKDQQIEMKRVVGVIASKIEDGTLFNAGIHEGVELAKMVRAMLARVDELESEVSALKGDGQLLDFLKSESLDLRCFGRGDDDIGWRTVQHHMDQPSERVTSEVNADDPRQAIREAMIRMGCDPCCGTDGFTGASPERPVQVATKASVEIERLQAIVRRAQQESDLIEHRGNPALAIPYWFINATTNWPESTN